MLFGGILLLRVYLSAGLRGKNISLGWTGMPPMRLLPSLLREETAAASCLADPWPREQPRCTSVGAGEVRARMPLSTQTPVGNKEGLVGDHPE